MKRKVASVFRALNKRGMTQAFIEIDNREFIFPSIIEKKRIVKKRYIFWMGITILLTGGIWLFNKLWYLDTSVISDNRHIVDQTDLYGMTPLHHAVIQLDKKRMDMLLELGAQINIQDSHGWSPLHWAVFRENENICRYLLNNGALTSIKTEKRWFKYPAGITPIEMAEIIDNKTIITFLKSRQKGKNE